MARFYEGPYFHRICKQTYDDYLPDWHQDEVLTGTSIMAVEYDGGVVLGADSRTTNGTVVVNRVTDKITKVTDYISCCRSGSSADTQALADIASYHLALHEVEMNEPTLVLTAANVFKELGYNYREQVTAGIICAGWDKSNGGQVYCIPMGGMCVRQPVALGGSGCTYIFGYADANYKPGMTQEDCASYVVNTLTLAMGRDGSSGGIIRLALIDKDGTHRRAILHDDLPKFYDD